jgi:nucleoid-associated protein YgaU
MMWKQLRKRFNSTESYVSLFLGLAVVLLLGSLVFNYLSARKLLPGQNTALSNQAGNGNETSTPPTSYTVASGDTLWSISEKFYKSGYNWVDLQKANKLTDADLIEVGQKLAIPMVTPIIPQGEISATNITAQPTPAKYTVVAGDDLWDISLKHYGTGYRWPDIAKANNLENPDIIHSGNVLILP